MAQSFYTAFEDRYRGSTSLVRERLVVYEALARASAGPVLDLGCGRGEWLTLLRDWGLQASGVDLEPGMVAACLQQGLAVESLDAVAALERCSSSSLGMVSALHLVEHLPFPLLESLVRESLRVLKPGGFLLMETPNAENLLVGANDFYTDPTHQKPIPSNLLRFLPEQLGFHRSEVVLLHERLPADRLLEAGLLGVLAGVSQDYAVVALAAEEPAANRALDDFVHSLPGISLQQACASYDQLHYEQLDQIGERLDGLAMTCSALHEDLQQQREALTLHQEAMHQAWQQMHAEIQALRSSASWRITAPLRLCTSFMRRLARRLVRRNPNGQLRPAVNPRTLLRAVGQDDPERDLSLRADARDLWRATESPRQQP
jgi:O-antigen chain-terminating methyltransferase